jgi:hypothetical protein
MRRLGFMLTRIGFEGWIFSLTGIAAIIFSVVGFFGFWPFDITQTIQILIGAVGALMLSVVSLTSKRQGEIQELRNALGISEAELVDYQHDYLPRLISSVTKTKRSISEMFVNWAIPRPGEHYFELYYDYNLLIANMTRVKKIKYRLIHVVYHRQGLEELIHRILLYEGLDYYVRHYEPPPSPMPVLHITSFDDETFYIGVGYPKGEPADNQVLLIRESKLSKIAKDYWRVLWDDARMINEGGYIDWEELKRIGTRLKMSDNDFDALVAKVRARVKIDRRKLNMR